MDALSTGAWEEVNRFVEIQRARYERLSSKVKHLSTFRDVSIDDLAPFEGIESAILSRYLWDQERLLAEIEEFFEQPFKNPVKTIDYLLVKHPVGVKSRFTDGNRWSQGIISPYFISEDEDDVRGLSALIADSEKETMNDIARRRIEIRDDLMAALLQQLGKEIIDLSLVDTYGSTQQALNYSIATNHPNYRIHLHEDAMISAAIANGMFDFNSGKLAVYCFSSGTGMNELATIAKIRDRYIGMHGCDLDLRIRFVERSDWSRFAVNVSKALGFKDVEMVTRDLYNEPIDQIVAEDSKGFGGDYSILLMSMNSMIGFTPDLQEKFIRELGRYTDDETRETKVMVSLTTQRDLFANTGLGYKMGAKLAKLPGYFYRELPMEQETNYRSMDLEPFIMYPVEELLLADPNSVRYEVWKDKDMHRNQRYNIGVRVIKPIPLFTQLGRKVMRNNEQAVIEPGTYLRFHQSTRFNLKRLVDLKGIGNFQLQLTENPQAMLYR